MAEAKQEARSDATGTGKAVKSGDSIGGTGVIARDQLKSIVERIERLEEEKQALADDIKEVYGEAKANGFDTKILRTVVKLRKEDANERQEREALPDLYLHALGMVTAEAAEKAAQ